MMVEIACLYTSCEWPSRRSSTQKLSNQVTTPCSLTPLTRKIVSGVLLFRTWLRKVSCRFCERSAAIVFVPFLSRAPSRELMAKSLAPLGRSIHQPLVNKDLDSSHYKAGEGMVQAEVGGRP